MERICKNVANRYASNEIWRVFGKINDSAYIMVRRVSGMIKFALLFIITISLDDISKVEESAEIADKLKCYRRRNGLLQNDVAEYLGIDRSTYIRYETNGHEYYPAECLEKLAELYKVDVTELADEYNLFLINGQTEQIKAKRLDLGLTQREFAQMLGVDINKVRKWEKNKTRISKRDWVIFREI